MTRKITLIQKVLYPISFFLVGMGYLMLTIELDLFMLLPFGIVLYFISFMWMMDYLFNKKKQEAT